MRAGEGWAVSGVVLAEDAQPGGEHVAAGLVGLRVSPLCCDEPCQGVKRTQRVGVAVAQEPSLIGEQVLA